MHECQCSLLYIWVSQDKVRVDSKWSVWEGESRGSVWLSYAYFSKGVKYWDLTCHYKRGFEERSIGTKSQFTYLRTSIEATLCKYKDMHSYVQPNKIKGIQSDYYHKEHKHEP